MQTPPKEGWVDQLEQLPSEKHIRTLFSLLRPEELQEIAVGLTQGVAAGCQQEDLMRIAEDLNGWIATAEEYVEFRKKRHHILKARQEMDSKS